MKVSSPAGSLLLTGDIEHQTESELVTFFDKKLDVDVVVVPHHGSKTSSSRPFIEMIDAEYAIFSVGYRNRYRLPNKQIVSRYKSTSASLFRTDVSGAVTVHFSKRDGINIELYREKFRRYWHHDLSLDLL